MAEKEFSRSPRRTKKMMPSTQQYLDIAEIKDDCVVLKDGSLRMILLVSSINFALKSADEQDAVISAYTQFLNSLEFPIQIVIQSRKLNINEYLESLKEREKKQSNELLKIQTADYRQFVTELVEMSEIMSKHFYVIVPYSFRTAKQKKFLDRLRETMSSTAVIRLSQTHFEKYREELVKRVMTVMSGLEVMDLKSVLLDTQSLIELFYNTYNPETRESQRLIQIGKLNLEDAL